MSEMVERMAAAHYEQWRGLGFGVVIPPSWSELSEQERLTLSASMRAAIKAMREPTDKMIAEVYAPKLAEQGKGWWRTMIDEALR